MLCKGLYGLILDARLLQIQGKSEASFNIVAGSAWSWTEELCCKRRTESTAVPRRCKDYISDNVRWVILTFQFDSNKKQNTQNVIHDDIMFHVNAMPVKKGYASTSWNQSVLWLAWNTSDWMSQVCGKSWHCQSCCQLQRPRRRSRCWYCLHWHHHTPSQGEDFVLYNLHCSLAITNDVHWTFHN